MENTERKIRNLSFFMVISTAVFILITALFIVTTVFYMLAVRKYMMRDKSEPAVAQTPVYSGPVTKHDITLSSFVSGNMSSREKYFRFRVEITGVDPGDAFTVEYDGNGFHADRVVKNTGTTREAYRGTAQPLRIIAGTDGVGKEDIYLAHGQSVVIHGVPSTAKYTVNVDSESYAPSVAATEGKVGPKKNTVTVNSVTADNTIVFKNIRSAMVPVGAVGPMIFISVFPFLYILALMFLFNLIEQALRRRKIGMRKNNTYL